MTDVIRKGKVYLWFGQSEDWDFGLDMIGLSLFSLYSGWKVNGVQGPGVREEVDLRCSNQNKICFSEQL